jgi:predicted phosphodiesterase
MRYAVLADIHANLTALEAVLQDIEARGRIDAFWCLGDIVGYGPDPRQCLAIIRKICSTCVAGNHDWAAVGKMDLSSFNNDAAEAARWTRQQLEEDESAYLAELPLVLIRDRLTLVHGSPRNPIWEYILSAVGAEDNFTFFQTSCCLIGHSHLPLFYEQEKNPVSASIPSEGLHELFDGQIVTLGQQKLILNPGSVGQPRDNDPRASYVIYDSEAATFQLQRVTYDVKSVQQRMAQAGLPDWLIERLAAGR